MLADEGVCKTLVRYLALYKDFKDPTKMKRLVGLMHRVVVNTRKEAFFFKVCLSRLETSVTRLEPVSDHF
jgi:hypothetical protein